MTRPAVFLLHALGSSAREWDAVVAELGAGFDCVALDLPGFGERAGDGCVSVSEMLDWLAGEVRARDPAAWMIVGHSMGGKLATLITARAEAGAIGLSALAGTVLVAGSPPSPEPMDEDRRATMLGWFARGQATEAQALEFVDANTAAPLPEPLRARAAADVRRSGRHAWLAWLERGACEDWSGEVDRLNTPVLIVAGADDGDLGADAQARLNAPLYARATVEVVADAAHLIPYEQPAQLAALIADHWARVAHRALPADFARALASDRASARTRAALLRRLDDPADDAPRCLSDRQLATLRALIARVLPHGGRAIDLARRLDRALAEGEGDGWRFAELPADVQAWAMGLDMLDAAGFAGLDAEAQDALLRRMADGGVEGAELSAAQARLWFEDVRAETVRHWLAHPATMARIGYDGVLNGGDGARFQGFARTGAEDPEPWEPRAAGAGADA